MRADFKKILKRIDPVMAIAKCIAIYISYSVGGYLTGLFHQETQYMGSMLAAISSIVVLQADVKTSIHQGWLRVFVCFWAFPIMVRWQQSRLSSYS